MGSITPSGLHFERHHAGIPDIDPFQHRLMVHGMVRAPRMFTMDDIRRMPRRNVVHFLECAANSGMEWRGAQLNGCQFTHGMVHNVMYTGVPLKAFLNEAGLKPKAKWLMLEGADASGMNRSLPIEKALADKINKEVFGGAHHPVPIHPDNLLGIRARFFWWMITVVTVK